MIALLDLAGVAVFAISGTLAATQARLDLFGVIVIAAVTAIGGGTLRDLLLGRHPVFWVADPKPLYVIVSASLLTLVYVRVLPIPDDALLVADAMGLAVFALVGAQLAEGTKCSAFVVVLMGTITGAGGGVLRDVLTSRTPLILRQDIYATAAIGGIVLYLLLQALGVARGKAFALGMASVVALRLAAIHWHLQLPAY